MKSIGKISHPASMYFLLTMAVVFCSWILNVYGFGVADPETGEWIQVLSLLSPEGIRWSLRNVVSNFTGFAPLGMVLVALLGIGLARHSGFMDACIRKVVRGKHRAKAVLWCVIGCGLLSNVIGDAGYVILLPVASMLFQSVGLPPAAGIVVAYVSVACGYSANLLMSTMDPILAATTQGVADDAGLATVQVGALSNYYFFLVSTPLLAGVIYRVARRRLWPCGKEDSLPAVPGRSTQLSRKEGRALGLALWMGAFYLLVILLVTFSPWGILRGVSGGLLRSPFIAGALFLISLGIGLMGMIYGFASGRYRADADVVAGFQHPVKLLGVYLVIAFWASQMFACLSYSHLDTWLVLAGGGFMSEVLGRCAGLGALCLFTLYVAVANLFMVSATAKWSLLAAVFLPVMLANGLPADAIQCAYRIGDSATNAITPFMFYMPWVLAYLRQYDRTATCLTLLKRTWPFTVAVTLAWMALLAVWYVTGLPFGL